MTTDELLELAAELIRDYEQLLHSELDISQWRNTQKKIASFYEEMADRKRPVTQVRFIQSIANNLACLLFEPGYPGTVNGLIVQWLDSYQKPSWWKDHDTITLEKMVREQVSNATK